MACMSRSKAAISAVVALAIALFFALDLWRFLDLELLKETQHFLVSAYAERPAAVLGLYFAAYVGVAAFSLPGAAVLTLAGGAMFGLFTGTLVASFASSVGALLAFLAARTVLRDAVRQRVGSRRQDVDAGVRRDGALYLATLRLVPLIPFFAVNPAMALTSIPAKTFYWVSQLAMLPGTVVYVNAGSRLATLDSLRGILSPALIGSLTLLALLPWLGRGVAAALQRRKVYARWATARPLRFDRNLVVIGAGAAGLVSAYLAAALKASVTLVESHKMGGDCLNYGCVPSKALIRTASLAHQMRNASRYGLQAAAPAFSFREVTQRIREVIRTIEPHDSVERFRRLGVDVPADAVPKHLRGGRRRRPLPVHPHRLAPGLVCHPECAVRRFAPVQGGLSRDPGRHLC